MGKASLNVSWNLNSLVEGTENARVFGYDANGMVVYANIDLDEARRVRDRLSIMLNDVATEQRLKEHRELAKLNDWTGLMP